MVARNAGANLAGMFTTILVQTLLAFGSYRLAGPEQFGMIALYNVVLVAAGIFDVGLGQSVVREVARLREREPAKLPSVVMTAGLLYTGLAATIMVGAWVLSPFIARHWLNPESVSVATLEHNLILLAIGVAIQRVRGAFQATLEGLERQVLVNILVTIAGFSRLALGLGSLAFVEPTAEAFFYAQLIASVIETGIFVIAVLLIVPGALRFTSFDRDMLKGMSGFAIVNMVATAVGTFIQLGDSLIVSLMLPLATYGKYSMVSTFCSGMVRLATPLGSAYYPRLVRMLEMNRLEEARADFYLFSQATFALLFAGAGALVIFGDWALFVASNDLKLAADFHLALAVLSVAYMLSGIARPSHALQLAAGKPGIALRVNFVTGTIALLVVWLTFRPLAAMGPSMAVVAPALGLACGNFVAWFFFNRLGPVAIVKGGGPLWFLRSAGPQLIAALAALALVRLVAGTVHAPVLMVILIVVACGLATGAAVLAANALRPAILRAIAPFLPLKGVWSR